MKEHSITVAVQGEQGSNSALAAAQFFGENAISLVPCTTFVELFSTVSAGTAAFGMAPVENSLAGSVHPVWELLGRTDCRVQGELYFHVRHCLIAHPSVPLQEIRRIYSHEQALAQCRSFLRKLVWLEPEDIIAAYDTAGAVKMVRARGKREEAAIASPRAAQIFGMRTLATDIQADPNNYTRFLVLGTPRGECGAGGDHAWQVVDPTPSSAAGHAQKSTLILTVDNSGSPLPVILDTVRQAQLELLKLETVKVVGKPWQYRVYLDLETSPLPADWQPADALPALTGHAREVRVVGTYPLAVQPPPPSQSSMS